MGTSTACVAESHTGKAPPLMLDEHTKEAFQAAQQGAVDHVRTVVLAVFADICQVESLGQVEGQTG